MKKYTSIALLIALLASLAACGDTGTSADTTISNEDTTTAPVDQYPDDLPDDLDFGGEAVNFLYRAEVLSEFYADTSNGDVVNDALYDSIRSVEERLNVDIVAVPRDGHLVGAREEYMGHMNATILAGDDAYDWVDLMIGNASVQQKAGIFLDVAENKYIDLEKPWYLADMVDEVGIDGKLYLISGDASLGYLKCTMALYFNTALVDVYKLENPYKLVDEGKWTLDKVMELTAIASQDVNADGVYNEEDKIGYCVHDNNHRNGWGQSAGVEFFAKNADGTRTFNLGTERDTLASEKYYKLINETQGAWWPKVANSVANQLEAYNNIAKKFASGDIFMMTAEIDDAVMQLRDMNDPYGILPYPKLDERQKEYISASRNTHNSFSMPVTCGDPDMAGAVMEALAASNYEKVLPAYFEVALKTKYARDDDTARMYDLIRASTRLTFAYTYNNAIGTPIGAFVGATQSNNLASQVASKKSAVDTSLASYYEEMRKLAE